jgi:hypothetical protein
MHRHSHQALSALRAEIDSHFEFDRRKSAQRGPVRMSELALFLNSLKKDPVVRAAAMCRHRTPLAQWEAYGNSRLGELVLGGVTGAILERMTLPVLMSH